MSRDERNFWLVALANLLIEPPLLYLIMVKTSGPALLTYHQMFPWLL